LIVGDGDARIVGPVRVPPDHDAPIAQADEATVASPLRDGAPMGGVATLTGGALRPAGLLALQAAAGNRATGRYLRRCTRTRARQPRPLLLRAPAETEPLIIACATFGEAAQLFAEILATAGETQPARIIVASGGAIQVYDQTGAAVPDGAFRFKRPVQFPAGVFRQLPGTDLAPILREGAGFRIGEPAAGDTDFSRDVEDPERFNRAISGGIFYYVFPTARPDQAERPSEPDQLPEFMEFEGPATANLRAWPAAVIPLTPQIATVGSTGTFVCHVEKNIGVNTIDRVTNLMEPTDFRWEVLKLDQALRVSGRSEATRWQGVKEGYERRLRHLEDDRRTLLGHRPEQQSLPQRVVREYLADQVTDARTILAITGQTALTVVQAVAGDTRTPNIENYIDVPWKEPGDYFVRCLATPRAAENAPNRRATSVAGVMVSVYDTSELAEASLGTVEDERKSAEDELARLELEQSTLEAAAARGEIDPIELAVRRRLMEARIAYARRRAETAGDTAATKAAELDFVRAQLAALRALVRAKGEPTTKRKPLPIEKEIAALEARERELATTLTAAAERVAGEKLTATGLMSAALVDEDTGERRALTFAVAERTYFNRNLLEVVIFDVTGKTGRRFSGSDYGREGEGRAGAWQAALRDLRRNLRRGRGVLSWRAPSLYAGLEGDVPNPMQLQMSELDQMRELVDDSVQTATLVALLAAPVTGGESLAVVAVLAPVAAGSSLYNTLDRAAYDDLHLDQAAVTDFVNIATVGLGHVGELRSGVRGLQIVATGSRVAVRLFDGGQYLVMTYEAFRDILGEPIPGEDERTARRRRLMALLNFVAGAGMPIAEHLLPPGARLRSDGTIDDAPDADPPRPGSEPAPSPTGELGGLGGLAGQKPVFKLREGQLVPAGAHPRQPPDTVVDKEAIRNAHGEDHVIERHRDGSFCRRSWDCEPMVENIRKRVAAMAAVLPAGSTHLANAKKVLEAAERVADASRDASVEQTRRETDIAGMPAGSKLRARRELELENFIRNTNNKLVDDAVKLEDRLANHELKAKLQGAAPRNYAGPLTQTTEQLEKNFHDVLADPALRRELEDIKALQADPSRGAEAEQRRAALQKRMFDVLEADLPHQVAAAEAARADVGVGLTGPDKGCLAKSPDGTKTESGWADYNRPGITQATKRVQAIGTEMGYTFPSSKRLDRSEAGRYHASHAEKQLNALKPGAPIGVSLPMCRDCFNYFRARARAMGRPLVVADPKVTRIFYPDGRVLTPSHTIAPAATGPFIQNAVTMAGLPQPSPSGAGGASGTPPPVPVP
jgi:hypothetical protein